ncbi:MAG: hypothetical protein BRC53_09080 [Cyanobacteria bacterium SW_6_48_11]|nr:MAG: hypothetical protein BRC53_09080 [Cyanobacteria bacterium SW_6_48_11]
MAGSDQDSQSPVKSLPVPDYSSTTLSAEASFSQLHSPGPECSPETLEEWMLVCAKAACAYLYPTLSSLNTPRPGQESGEQLDQLVGDVDDSLLSNLIAEEESQTRQTQQSQINTVLISALAKLDSQVQQLLEAVLRSRTDSTRDGRTVKYETVYYLAAIL